MTDDCYQNAHTPHHMSGWEAFGVTGTEPTVRRLGNLTSKGKMVLGTEPWGEGESVGGVASIELHSHADAPAAFLYVCGPGQEVERVWRQASAAFEQFREASWAGCALGEDR